MPLGEFGDWSSGSHYAGSLVSSLATSLKGQTLSSYTIGELLIKQNLEMDVVQISTKCIFCHEQMLQGF